MIGDPISHSRSPQMHAAAFQALGLPFSYNAIRVSSGEVALALERLLALGYRGINVTVPLKEEVASFVVADAFAARCGAVNTVDLANLWGINTDGPGFLDTLKGAIPPGATVLMLGAGGSARAIALALVLDGYNLRIYNRTTERALTLIRELSIEAEVVENPALQDVQLIVNATSASLNQQSLPISFAQAPRSAVAYDLVYGDSPFLAAAAQAGLRTIDGKPLLAAQGARSLEYWLGVGAPRDAMLEAIQ